ncbi:MAG: sortase [Clostridia bacterium]|nr:sortase [Clostridia bacterium]
MKSKKVGTLFIVIGIIFIGIAITFYINNYIEDKKAGIASEQVMTKIIGKEKSHGDEITTEMTILNIDGNDYIGYITIPKINIQLPVMSDWNYDKLKIAPCRYNGWTETDNFVIAAHNYQRHFGKLSQLKQGDSLTFTDMNGNVYMYEVGDIELLPPTATEEMIKSDWDLSLYTCVYSATKRVTVRCKKVGMYNYNR